MSHDLARVADAAVAALAEDPEGYAMLTADLNPTQARQLGARLAALCATSVTERAEDTGLTREDALTMWRAVIAHQHGARE